MSDKRPETDADILSRSTELSFDFATGAQQPGGAITTIWPVTWPGTTQQCGTYTMREEDFSCNAASWRVRHQG